MFSQLAKGEHIEEFEAVRQRCALCVFQEPFPPRTVVEAALLPPQYHAASPAVQRVWYDHEVNPYLRESDRKPKFDWKAACVEDCVAAADWEFNNGY